MDMSADSLFTNEYQEDPKRINLMVQKADLEMELQSSIIASFA